MICKCENERCGEAFDAQLHVKPTEQGGEYRYFTCPKCSTEYAVSTITAYGVRLREHLKGMQESLKWRPDFMPRVQRLQAELRRETRVHMQ